MQNAIAQPQDLDTGFDFGNIIRFSFILELAPDAKASLTGYVGNDNVLRITSIGQNAAMETGNLVQIAAWLSAHQEWLTELICRHYAENH